MVDLNDNRLARGGESHLKSGIVREEVTELELEEKKTNMRIREEVTKNDLWRAKSRLKSDDIYSIQLCEWG